MKPIPLNLNINHSFLLTKSLPEFPKTGGLLSDTLQISFKGSNSTEDSLINDIREIEESCANSKFTPFHITAMYYKNPELIHYFAKKGVDVNAPDSNGKTALHLAAIYNKSTELIKALISENALVNARDNKQRTPLHYAAIYQNDSEYIKTLIEAGADVEAKDYKKRTPMHYAAMYDNVKFAKKLRKYGAQINITDKEGCTPIKYAKEYYNRLAGDFLQEQLKIENRK